MKSNPFKGFGVALATPFRTDGTVDHTALRSLVRDIIDNGADFLCVLGTTAETPTLTFEEREAIKQTAKEETRGCMPLLLGAGGNCTQAVCEELRRKGSTEGFDGVLIVTPFYNKPSQEGLFQHYKAVSAATPLPVVLYNVPGRTGVNLMPETVLRLALACENIVAIKEASGRVVQAQDIIRDAPDGFDVICGDDGITPELLSVGAVGVISVIGNAFPQAFADMTHAGIEGDFAKVREIHQRLNPFYRLMLVDGNPAGIKSLLALQHKAENILRLPLVPASEATQKALREAME